MPDPDEICQGAAGDCWFLSALSILAMQPDLVRNVFATEEVLPLTEGGEASGRKGESAGIFGVCFHKDGEWRTVVVDDHFPTSRHGTHLFAHSRGTELWVCVLEKAYASLHGSYAAIEGGFIEDALVDLTGGIKISPPKIEPDSSEGMETAWKQIEELASSGQLPNMLEESRRQVPMGMHTYLNIDKVTNETEDHCRKLKENGCDVTKYEN